MKRKPLRTVLIGFGAIAQGLAADPKMAAYFSYATHAQVLRDHPSFDWIATIDPRAAARRLVADWNPGPAAAEINRGIEALAPEIAVLAVPPEARLVAIERLCELRGVIVEKPLGRTLAEARTFLAACVKRKISVQVCYWRRGDRTLQKLAAARAAQLGAIQAGFGVYGNGLRNNGSHLIDLIAMQAGPIVAVRAIGAARAVARAPLVDDVGIAAALELANGAVVAIQPIDFALYREVSLDLWGTKRRRNFDQETLRIADFKVVAHRALLGAREVANDLPHLHPNTVEKAFFRLYDDFADALARGHEPASGAANALRTEITIDAILRSAARGGARVPVRPA